MVKKLVVDLDNTICVRGLHEEYSEALPNEEVIEKLRSYHRLGWEICIFTSRNMRTYQGNLGKINANTLPIIVQWLELHSVPYDEIFVGKPWCGDHGFYVDDRAIRPSEFVEMSLNEIDALLAKE